MKIWVKVFGLQRQCVTLNAARLSTFHHTMSPPDGASVNSPCTTDGRILVSFGIIADVHYADIANGSNFAKTRMRYYRNSLSLLSDAIRHWNDRSDVSFVLQLGDLIDGHNKRNGTSDIALQKTLGVCAQFNGPTYHIWGNHELYNFTRRQLAESQLNSSRKHPEINIDENSHATTDSEQPCNYYHFSPAHGFRIVVIDTYDVGKLGYESTCPQFVAAERLLASKNPNEDKNSPVGLHGLDARFVEYNGGLGQKQLQWLRQVLHTADTAHEKVFIVGHIPLFVESSNASSLCWNYSEVLDVMHTFPQCIVAYIAGHDHDGGQAIDACGVQHITVEGVIETPPGGRAFANVHVYSDKIIVDGGGGRVTSTVIKL